MKASGQRRQWKLLITGVLVVAVAFEMALVMQKPPVNAEEEVVKCMKSGQGEEKQCLQKVIGKIVRQDGVDSAMQVLADKYDRDPSFGETCHSLTHAVGEDAYELFAANKPFRVTDKTAYCSYGFYHGFMEALVSHQGDIRVASRFCDYVDKQIAKEKPDATLQCFHGIGHGTVNNHDPKTWGNADIMIRNALAICEKASQTEDQLSRCATGTFNGIAIFMIGGQYKLTYDKADPFAVCRKQPEKYKDACYISFNLVVMAAVGSDVVKAAPFVEAIPEDGIAQHTILNVMSLSSLQLAKGGKHENVIAFCRSLQPRLQKWCIDGYAYGFLEHGPPEREYVGAMEICKLNYLTREEQKSCFEYISYYLLQWYPTPKVTTICESIIDTEFKTMCLSKIKRQ